MFASLRYRRKHDYRSFPFASLRYVCALQKYVCADPEGVYTTWALAASERVCTTEAWAAPGGVYTKGSWTAYESVCTTEACAAPGGVYTTWALAASERVCTTEACAAPGGVYTQGPELHLNVSALQRPVLLLEVSTPQGPKLIWTCLLYRVLCCSWRSLIRQGPVPTYCRTCSLRFENNFLAIYCIRFASKIILSLSIVFASLRKIICVLSEVFASLLN